MSARYAAFGSAALASAKAQSSQGVSASTSPVSDRRAAPDAQARRRVAVIGDVVGDAFLLQQAGERLGERRLFVGRQPRHRRIDHLQAHRGVRALARRCWRDDATQGVAATQSASALALASERAMVAVEAADRFRPGERVEIVLDAQHRRRVDGLAVRRCLR